MLLVLGIKASFLYSRIATLSGKRGSNPRPPAWKASALSTELFPQKRFALESGRWWIRTTEVERQQIYSLPHLAALETTLNVLLLLSSLGFLPFQSLLSDSNQRPRDYKSRALANWAKEAYSKHPLTDLESFISESGCKGTTYFWKPVILLYYFYILGHYYLFYYLS